MRFLRALFAFFWKVKQEIKLCYFQVEWREKNKHNYTKVSKIFPIEKVTVDVGTYGTLNVISYGNSTEKLRIGKYCSIAAGTTFVLSGEHEYNTISTFPFEQIVLKENIEAKCK